MTAGRWRDADYARTRVHPFVNRQKTTDRHGRSYVKMGEYRIYNQRMRISTGKVGVRGSENTQGDFRPSGWEWTLVINGFFNDSISDIGVSLAEYPNVIKWHREISRKESFKRSQSSSFKLWLKHLLSIKTKIQRFLGWGVRGCEYR